MKLKIALFFSIVILLVFVIYLTTLDKEISYVAIGDYLTVGVNADKKQDYGYSNYVYEYLKEKNVVSEYITEFSDSTYRTTDLIRDIKDNKKLYDEQVKNAKYISNFYSKDNVYKMWKEFYTSILKK